MEQDWNCSTGACTISRRSLVYWMSLADDSIQLVPLRESSGPTILSQSAAEQTAAAEATICGKCRSGVRHCTCHCTLTL